MTLYELHWKQIFVNQLPQSSSVQFSLVQYNPIGSRLFERTAGPGGGVGHHVFAPLDKTPQS